MCLPRLAVASAGIALSLLLSLCASSPIAASAPAGALVHETSRPFTAVALPALPPGAREPHVAIGGSGTVYVAFGAGDALYCSVSRDGGKTFGDPVRVGQAGKLALGMRRGPRVAAASGETVVITAIYGEQDGGAQGAAKPSAKEHGAAGHQRPAAGHGSQSGELFAWRSTDGGKTWQGPARVSDVPGAAREGLHAMAASPDGWTLACTWLDLRGKGTEMYLALSRDAGATWEKNTRVYSSPDGTICECCHPSLAIGPGGELLVMWRNWLGGARDMYLARSTDGGKTFGAAEKLGSGTWPLNACPMDGGALAVTPDGSVATFWRRDQEMYLCAPGGREKRIGRGQQGWVAAGTGGIYAVWLEGRPGRLLALAPGRKEPVPLADEANNPTVSSNGNGPVVVTWTVGKRGEPTRIAAVVLHPRN